MTPSPLSSEDNFREMQKMSLLFAGVTSLLRAAAGSRGSSSDGHTRTHAQMHVGELDETLKTSLLFGRVQAFLARSCGSLAPW